jgi:hypothetical protein
MPKLRFTTLPFASQPAYAGTEQGVFVDAFPTVKRAVGGFGVIGWYGDGTVRVALYVPGVSGVFPTVVKVPLLAVVSVPP